MKKKMDSSYFFFFKGYSLWVSLGIYLVRTSLLNDPALIGITLESLDIIQTIGKMISGNSAGKN